MKKITLYIILSIALFAACKKDGIPKIDEKNPEQRVTEALTKYNDLLTGSAYGWKAFLYPKGGGGYSFYLNFNKSNRVSMYADLANNSSQTSFESAYSIKSMQVPTLSFDTYNYLHLLSDPSPDVFGGTPGIGRSSDFEFTFDQQVGDTLKLTGKLLESKMILVKATQAEQQSYNAKGLHQTISAIINYLAINKNLYVLLGDATKIQTSIDVSGKVFSLTYESNGQINTTSTNFSFSLNGIILQNPLYYKGKKITELTWDNTAKLFYTMLDGNKVIVQSSPTPILPLHLLIGINYKSIIVPGAANYPGWGTDFITQRAAAAANLAAIGVFLDRMVFKFNSINKELVIAIDIYQGGNGFVAEFPYTYTKTPTGTYKFTAGALSGNASIIAPFMDPLLKQRINIDQLTLDYFTDPNTGASLGQFKSIQRPTFTFTGLLQ